ncbi:MAG TPA: hypothetical protein VER37_04130, partial [Thermomicrobiales bacterium]|nr:hypothetical protein [Thermomicrobiales bacterium]
MGKTLGNDEFAEFVVVGDEDPQLAVRKLEHVTVGQARGMVACNGCHVVTEATQTGNETRLDVLVQQGSHRGSTPTGC